MSSEHAPESSSIPHAEVDSPASSESRRGRLVRHGRRLRLYGLAGLFVALFAVLVVLISANTRTVKLDGVVGSTHASLVWVILAAALLGWLLGIITAVVFRYRTRRLR